MQLGFLAEGDNVTDSHQPLSARLLHKIGLHSPQHGGVGISFPIATPRGRSSKFP